MLCLPVETFTRPVIAWGPERLGRSAPGRYAVVRMNNNDTGNDTTDTLCYDVEWAGPRAAVLVPCRPWQVRHMRGVSSWRDVYDALCLRLA